MTNEKQSKTTKRTSRYERVAISSVTGKRRGKHHDVLREILEDLETLPVGTAMKIPLDELPGVTLANLRSAVHRATAGEKIQVETSSDDGHLYIWKPGK